MSVRKPKSKLVPRGHNGVFDMHNLLREMHENMSNCIFLIRGCELINKHMSEPGANMEEVVRVLVTVMRNHRERKPLQFSACTCLENLLSEFPSAANQACFLDSGGLDTVFATMNQHKEDAEVRAAACTVLCIVCMSFEWSATQRMPALSIAEATMQAFKSSKKSLDMELHMACIQIFFMLCKNELYELLKSDIAGDIIEASVKIMRMSMQFPPIQHLGIFVLFTFAACRESNWDQVRFTEDEAYEIMWANGTVSLVLSFIDAMLLRDVPASEQDQAQDFCERATLLIHGIYQSVMGRARGGVLGASVEDGPVQREETSLGAVLLAMRKFPKNDVIQLSALRALCSLCLNKTAHRVFFGVQALEMVVATMKKYSKNAEFAQAGFTALLSLSIGVAENTLYVMEHVAFLVNLAGGNPDEPNVQADLLCLFVGMVSTCHDAREMMVRAGCIQTTVQIMERYRHVAQEAGQRDIVDACCVVLSHTLESITDKNLLTMSLFDQGALQAVTNCIAPGVRNRISTVKRCAEVLPDLVKKLEYFKDSEEFNTRCIPYLRRMIQPLIFTVDMCRAEDKLHSSLSRCMGAVLYYVSEDACMDHFRESGGVSALVKLLRLLENDLRMQAESPTGILLALAEVEHIALCLRCAVMRHTESQKQAEKCGAIELVLTIMTMCSCMSTPGCYQVLHALCVNHEENTATLLRKGSIRGICNAIQMVRTGRALHGTYSERDPMLKERLDVGIERWQSEAVGELEQILQRFTCEDEEIHELIASLELRKHDKRFDKCVCCGVTAEMKGLRRLMKCSACSLAPAYCSAECQRVCWNAHKAECKANRKMKNSN